VIRPLPDSAPVPTDTPPPLLTAMRSPLMVVDPEVMLIVPGPFMVMLDVDVPLLKVNEDTAGAVVGLLR